MLTETEARHLLQQAADTIEVGPAGGFAEPPPRRVGPVVLIAAAAVLAIVAGLFVWHARGQAPAGRPGGSVEVPSVFGYDGPGAQQRLESAGLQPVVRTHATCAEPSGRALRTDPPVGTRLTAGASVTVVVADLGALRCLADLGRAQAWQLVDLATGHGQGPRFAPYLDLGVSNGQTVTVPADPASGPDQWLACPADDPGCPGTVLDVLRQAAAETGRSDGRVVTPELVVGTNPKPWGMEPARAVQSFRFLIDLPHPGPRHPLWSVDTYYDARGRLLGVDLHWGAWDASDPQPEAGPPGVGPDPLGVGDRFVAFASDSSHAPPLPIDTPVGLYLDNRHVKTISSADASDPQAWAVCPGLTSSCPSSALGAVVEMQLQTLGLSFSTRIPDPSDCFDTRGAPGNTGGNQVLVIDGAGAAASCRHRFEVQIYANDVGQIVAVNLLTPRDSPRSTGP